MPTVQSDRFKTVNRFATRILKILTQRIAQKQNCIEPPMKKLMALLKNAMGFRFT